MGAFTKQGGRTFVPAKDIYMRGDVRRFVIPVTSDLTAPVLLSTWENTVSLYVMKVAKTFLILASQSLVESEMESESELIWTLIQSFSIDQRRFLEDKGFGVDYPLGEVLPNINWNFYRLSLPHMQYLASQSTHLRATCNFSVEGLSFTDYFRTVLRTHYIFTTFDGECRWYGQLNIRGVQCFSCSAFTIQKKGRAWFINSYSSKGNGCQFDGRPGRQDRPGSGEHNFGRYADGKVNHNHRCSASNSSTTEHWFGIKRNLFTLSQCSFISDYVIFAQSTVLFLLVFFVLI